VITAEHWYEPNPELRNYYQGDILSGIPFPTLPTFLPAVNQDVWGILRPRQNRGRVENRPVGEILRNLPNELIGRAAKDVVDAWVDQDGEHIIAHCRRRCVMLISRSCDIDKPSRKHFLVAPVVAFAELQVAQRTDEKLRDLRANDIFHWFYLPAREPNLSEGYADLSQMLPLHRTFFDGKVLRTCLIARLSALGTATLQTALSNFYGTQFGFTSKDTCPQTGRYACSSCFHSGQSHPEIRDINEGVIFGNCAICVEGAIWVKLPDPAP
jgi:hypothetical protein